MIQNHNCKKLIYQENAEPFLLRLRGLYEQMDIEYNKAAQYYGFVCNGCNDNCCYSLFYHHTHIEHHYLIDGLERLDESLQNDIKQKASQVSQAYLLANQQGQKAKVLCPLNFDTKCILYNYRPMICRLHGIAHELNQYDSVQHNPGCLVFTESVRLKKLSYYPFNRTPLYVSMAKLEHAFKAVMCIDGKLKMTVADMILSQPVFGLNN